jgi:predicted ATPase
VLSDEHGFPSWAAAATVERGWARVQLGDGKEGVAQIRQGIIAFLDTGTQAGKTRHQGLLADAYRTVGRPADGLAVLDDAFTFTARTAEREGEAELYRLKGELLLLQAERQTQEVETCFQRAIDIARQQEAKSWELRAATSLARLWQSQGKTIEARDLLAPVYHWFTEGFDTADLKDAKLLLDTLT